MFKKIDGQKSDVFSPMFVPPKKVPRPSPQGRRPDPLLPGRRWPRGDALQRPGVPGLRGGGRWSSGTRRRSKK